jgi:hypothetical protein
MKKLKVINFFGGPGCGKSTTSAGVFHKMKVLGLKVELVTEYAKDMVYENRANILADQLYVLAKQTRRVARLQGLVDYCVTDSPILLSSIYNTGSSLIDDLALEIFNGFDNYNFFIYRSKPYMKYGRGQTEDEAIEIDNKIFKKLVDTRIPYDIITAEDTIEIVTKTVCQH